MSHDIITLSIETVEDDEDTEDDEDSWKIQSEEEEITIQGECKVRIWGREDYYPYCMPPVSRQVYAETSGLIFKLNTFLAYRVSDLDDISEDLSLRNIQSLHFYNVSAVYRMFSQSIFITNTFWTEAEPKEPYLTRWFSKLRHFIISTSEYQDLWKAHTRNWKGTFPQELTGMYRSLLEQRIREKEDNMGLKFTWVDPRM